MFSFQLPAWFFPCPFVFRLRKLVLDSNWRKYCEMWPKFLGDKYLKLIQRCLLSDWFGKVFFFSWREMWLVESCHLASLATAAHCRWITIDQTPHLHCKIRRRSQPHLECTSAELSYTVDVSWYLHRPDCSWDEMKRNFTVRRSRIWGSVFSGWESDYSSLGCDALWFGKWSSVALVCQTTGHRVPESAPLATDIRNFVVCALNSLLCDV